MQIYEDVPPEPIGRWESEGGSPPLDDEGMDVEPRAESDLVAGVRRVVDRLEAHVHEHPLLTIAAALGVGIVIGAGVRRYPSAQAVLSWMLAPTLTRAIRAVT